MKTKFGWEPAKASVLKLQPSNSPKVNLTKILRISTQLFDINPVFLKNCSSMFSLLRGSTLLELTVGLPITGETVLWQLAYPVKALRLAEPRGVGLGEVNQSADAAVGADAGLGG